MTNIFFTAIDTLVFIYHKNNFYHKISPRFQLYITSNVFIYQKNLIIISESKNYLIIINDRFTNKGILCIQMPPKYFGSYQLFISIISRAICTIQRGIVYKQDYNVICTKLIFKRRP